MSKKELWDVLDEPESSKAHADKVSLLSAKKRLLIGIGAALLICVLGFAVPPLAEAILPAPTETSDTSVSANFSVTAYANDGTETVLAPDTPVTLGEYAPSDSTPGLPFRIDAAASIDIDHVLVEVGGGSLATWAPPNDTADTVGSVYIGAVGDTVYWVPLDTAEHPVAQCTMTVSALHDGAVVYKAYILLTHTQAYSYEAELIALKSQE